MLDIFYDLVSEIPSYSDRDAYVSDLSLSELWGDDPGADIPCERVTYLASLWDVYHMTMVELLQTAGVRMTTLSRRYAIPYRTIQGWCGETRECATYIKFMIARLIGVLCDAP